MSPPTSPSVGLLGSLALSDSSKWAEVVTPTTNSASSGCLDNISVYFQFQLVISRWWSCFRSRTISACRLCVWADLLVFKSLYSLCQRLVQTDNLLLKMDAFPGVLSRALVRHWPLLNCGSNTPSGKKSASAAPVLRINLTLTI